VAYLESSPVLRPKVSPALFIGAASPLWGYFGAAAAGGMAYWWMTRLAQPVKLEALFDRTLAVMKKPLEVAPPQEALDVVANTVAAPIEAVMEMVEPAVPPTPEPVTLVAAPPAGPESVPEVWAEPAEELTTKKPKKAAPPADDEA
jgi:hypothetical protein